MQKTNIKIYSMATEKKRRDKEKQNARTREVKEKKQAQPMSPKAGIGRRKKYGCGGKLKK